MPWHALIFPAALLLAYAAGRFEHHLRSRTPSHRRPRLTCDGVNCPDGRCFCGAFE